MTPRDATQTPFVERQQRERTIRRVAPELRETWLDRFVDTSVGHTIFWICLTLACVEFWALVL